MQVKPNIRKSSKLLVNSIHMIRKTTGNAKPEQDEYQLPDEHLNACTVHVSVDSLPGLTQEEYIFVTNA